MPLTFDEATKKVTMLYGRLSARRRDIDSLNSYFRGEQPLVYASEEWRKFHQGRFYEIYETTFDLLGLPRAGVLTVTMPGFGTTERTLANARRRSSLRLKHGMITLTRVTPEQRVGGLQLPAPAGWRTAAARSSRDA